MLTPFGGHIGIVCAAVGGAAMTKYLRKYIKKQIMDAIIINIDQEEYLTEKEKIFLKKIFRKGEEND